MSELPFLNEYSTMLRGGCFVYWGQFLFFNIISLRGRAWRRETSGRGEEWRPGGGAHNTNLTKSQTQSAHKQQQYYIFDQSMIDSVYCSWRVLLYYYFLVFTMSKSLINESI